MHGAQEDDEEELKLNCEENDNAMERLSIKLERHPSQPTPASKGKAATTAKPKKKQPMGRSRSDGATRNRSRSKPRLSGAHGSDSEWVTDEEAAHPSSSSHHPDVDFLPCMQAGTLPSPCAKLHGGGETSETDRVFASLAYDRFLKPKAPVASSNYDALHRAFINKTHEASLMARAKAVSGAAFAQVTPDKPNPKLKPDPKSPKKPPTAPKQ
eukprot:jgi/Tetstr1/424928/TSEL_015421.t1